MILIGQFDSPFVRRVAVTLRLYQMPFEHRPLSVFSDAEAVAAINPLMRVPTLVLDDGTVLLESTAILDWLDEQSGEAALIPKRGLARRDALRVCALASGVSEKAVALIYERVLHDTVSVGWIERCRGQIGRVLRALEDERARTQTPFWFGDRIGHADVAVACAFRFLAEAHPGVFELSFYPALAKLSERCEALDAFRGAVQAFVPPR